MSNDSPRWRLCLYVAGTGDLATRARQNLLTAVQRQLEGRTVDLEIVDVLESPSRAVEDEVLLTPTLKVYEPGPIATIVGDLSDEVRLSEVLSRDRADGSGRPAQHAVVPI